jgi:hypothetical protein
MRGSISSGSKADIAGLCLDVCFVPKADIAHWLLSWVISWIAMLPVVVLAAPIIRSVSFHLTSGK